MYKRQPGYNEFVSSSIIGDDPSVDNITSVIAECVDQIYDKEDVYDSSTTTKKEFVEFIENLTTSQFQKIQKFFETVPRVEHRFVVKNPNTGVPSEFVITGLSNFFG